MSSYPYHGGGMVDSNPSCRQLIAHPAQFDSNNRAPFQPMQDLPPHLQQYVPAMAVKVGQLLARLSQNNAAFIYFTNNILLGQYNNQLWHQTVTFGMMQLWVKTGNPQGLAIENLIEIAAGDAVVMKASFLACQNPTVFNLLPLDIQGEVRNLAVQHDQCRADFQNLMTHYTQQRMLQSNPQAYGAAIGGLVGAAIAGPTPATPTSNLYGNPVSKVRPPGEHQAYMPAATSGLPSQLKRIEPRYKQNKHDPFSSFDAPPAPAPAPAPVSLGKVTEMVTGQPAKTAAIAEPEVVSAEDWVPTEGQFYKPAYITPEYKMVYERVVLSDGKKAVVALIQQNDEEAMNEAEHQIPTLNRAMREALAARKNQPAGEAVVSDLALLVQGVSKSRKNETPEQTEKLKSLGLDDDNAIDMLGSETSVEGLVTAARQQRLVKGSDASVYLSIGVLSTSLVTSSDKVGPMIEKLGKAATLVEAVNCLNDAVDQNKDDVELLAVVCQIGRYLTNEVNFILQRRMGIDVVVTDMLQDTQELFDHLRKMHGQFYFDAFTAYQVKLVRSLFGTERLGVHVVQGEDQPPVGHRVELDREIGVALLSMDSSEFGVEIKGNEAYEVFSSNFPGLEPFITSIIDAWDNVDRVVLVTLDGKYFGVHRSIMGDKPAILFNA